jgi:hypothetical protein
MKTACWLLLLAAPGLARGDVVLDWNDAALAAIRRTSTPPPQAARALAMMHVALYDAVNSIDQTHQPFRVHAPDSPTTSREAAAAQAAFRVLLHLYPGERAGLEAALTQSLLRVPDGPSKSAGVGLGDIVAENIIAWRSHDGSQASVTYHPSAQPGQWQPTLPDFIPALLPQWPAVKPFGIPRAAQFRPQFPPDLRSAEYARHWREVKAQGAAESRVRTADQTEIAHAWADGAGTATPPGHWNRIAQTIARSRGLSLAENARLFALLNVALADAAIVCWDMKFACNLWRPITAIREAETDGNDQTQPDPQWLPLLDTPPFPSCTSGHSTFSGAAAQALALFFGRDDVRFTDLPETGRRSRSYTGFWQAAQEAGRSRIYGGIHFEFDNQAGLESGRAVGRYVFEHYFQPRAAPRTDLVQREAYRWTPSESYATPATTGSYPSDGAMTYSSFDAGWYSSSSYLVPHDAPRVTYAPLILQPESAGVFEYPAAIAEQPTIELPQPAVTYYLDAGW